MYLVFEKDLRLFLSIKKAKMLLETENDRPISPTSTVAKLIKQVAINKLNWFLETNDLLRHEVDDFHRSMSNVEQMANLG